MRKIYINGESIGELLFKDSNDELTKLDKVIGHIKRNKKRYARLVFILSLIVPASTLQVFAATDIGLKAYQMGLYVSKAICLLGWLTDCIKCVLTGTVDGLGKVSIKWISFALIVKFLPAVVEWIFNV